MYIDMIINKAIYIYVVAFKFMTYTFLGAAGENNFILALKTMAFSNAPQAKILVILVKCFWKV